jgi:hypothetical protein
MSVDFPLVEGSNGKGCFSLGLWQTTVLIIGNSTARKLEKPCYITWRMSVTMVL